MDKGSAVRDMFERIAGRYDLANSVMTGGLDALWRKRAVASLALAPEASVLDVCCGTGVLTRELARQVGSGRVAGVDFAENMLAVARTHRAGNNISYQRADALALPFPDRSFDAAAMAFSMRNITNIGACLREIARVLRPGGSFVNLEVGNPPNPVLRRAFHAYFYGVIPVLGGLVGKDKAAYRYLPQSLINFPDARALTDLFCANGFAHVRCEPLAGGVVNLHVGSVAAQAGTTFENLYAVSGA